MSVNDQKPLLQDPLGSLVMDRTFFHHAKTLLPPLFSPRRPSNGLYSFVLVLIACGISEVAAYFVGKVPSEFYSVLVAKDKARFVNVTLLALLAVLMAALCNAVVELCAGFLEIRIRNTITRLLQGYYLRAPHFYRVAKLSNLDNPDQRIAQDAEKFSASLRILFQKLCMSPFVIPYYTYRCWEISGFFGPALLYAYFVLSVIITRLVMPWVVKMVIRREKEEGQFRFYHTNAWISAEEIAFYHGEERERITLSNQLDVLLTYQGSIVKRSFPLNGSPLLSQPQDILNRGGPYYLIIAIPLLSGKLDTVKEGDLAQIISLVCLFYGILNEFTTITEQSGLFTNFIGFTVRIGQLLDACRETSDPSELRAVLNTFADQKNLVINNLTVKTPNGELLLKDLSLSLKPGKNLLITGPNGSGKTSLIRTISNLWSDYSGTITMPFLTNLDNSTSNSSNNNDRSIGYIPQKGLVVSGTLIDQLTYPDTDTKDVDFDEVMELLQVVNLGEFKILLEKNSYLDVREWERLSSPGQRQKLAFVRMFLHKPRLVFLDEATSAMDEASEAQVYEFCRKQGVWLISIGQKSSLRKWHDVELLLDGKGGFRILDLE